MVAVFGAVVAARLSVGPTASAPPALLSVRAELPGIDAATLEAMVTLPLETAVRASGSERVESRTRDGRVDVVLQFRSPAARDRALEAVRGYVAAALARLPMGMSVPTVEAREPSRPPAVAYAVTARDLEAGTERWVEQALADPLRELPEVAAVAVEGAGEREIIIEPDLRRLAALGLTFDSLMQALQGQDEAPAGRKRKGRAVAAPGSVESIAARAVRLPSGEPIALAEVARAFERQRRASGPPRVGNAAALRLAIYPATPAEAVRASERAHAHLAWLRANGLVPPDVVVQVLQDQALAVKGWLKQLAQRTAVLVALALLVVALAFGRRRCVLLACGFGVWLPGSATLLWAGGFALDTATVAGLTLAAVPLTLLLAAPAMARLAMLTAAAAGIAWVAGLWLDEYRSLTDVFALGGLLAILVAWLLSPWRYQRESSAPLLRLLWSRGGNAPFALTVTACIVVAAVLLNLRAFAMSSPFPAGDTVLVRMYGDDAQQLAAAGTAALSALRGVAGVERTLFSAAPEETWRLQLDEDRLEELGITVAEVGRALAIARSGLPAGETVSGDEVFRLRVQLPAGAAGEQFERLLLRGERGKQRAVYLRDVGLALREWQPHARLRIDGRPAVEVVVRARNAEARAAVARLCQGIAAPQGQARECDVVDWLWYQQHN